MIRKGVLKMAAEDIFDKLKLIVIKGFRIYCVNKNNNRYFKLLKKHGIEKKKLTSEQKKSIKKVWGRGCEYDTHILTYSVTGEFNPYIMPEKLFRTKIEPELNNQSFKYSWADKAYLGFHFPKELFPKTIVNNINGIYYDEDYNILTENDAIERISKYDRFVIKPSLDSGFGKGVKLCINDGNVKDELDKYRKNFVVQEVFKQHQIFSQFNSSSVNVIRYISIFINGKVVPVMAALRCGAEGAFNDNFVSEDGLGMFVIGIDENGRLRDKAYHSCGRSISKCPNGTEFSGVEVPGFDKMKEIIVELHSKLAYFGFIGWDFVIDEDGNPKIMEYNLKAPGVLYYQYVNGPLLGEYTEDIIKMLK